MKRTFEHLLRVLAVAGAMLVSVTASGQAPVAAGPRDRNCTSAERKVAREQGYLEGVEDSIASKQRALQACGTKSLCNKLETNIKAMGRMKLRHEKRIQRYSATRDAACKAKG